MTATRQLRLWKFVIPTDREYPVPSRPGLKVRGLLVVAKAYDEAEARAIILEEARVAGMPMEWLEIARVESIDVEKPGFVAVSM